MTDRRTSDAWRPVEEWENDGLAALYELMLGPPWKKYAACQGMCQDGKEPNPFFPVFDRRRQFREDAEAKAICRTCPVRKECLEYALSFSIHDGDCPGIWGGTTEDERQRILKLRRQGIEVA